MIHINLGNYEGFIFDLDGTLADSMPFHFRAWKETLQQMVGSADIFTEEFCYQNAGRPAKAIIEWLNQKQGWNLNLPEFVAAKERCFMSFVPRIKPIESVVKVVKKLGRESRSAVASGSNLRDALQ